MAGVVLMLMAGFAPYLTYKAIGFMGFDMYHAMSAEQEAKAALNRPMPIPLVAGAPAASRPRSWATAAERWRWRYDVRRLARGRGTVRLADRRAVRAAVAPGAGGAAGGGAAAAGGAVAAGVVVAKEAAAAGPRLGNFVAAQATGQAEAHESAAPSTVPPPVADSTLAEPAGTEVIGREPRRPRRTGARPRSSSPASPGAAYCSGCPDRNS